MQHSRILSALALTGAILAGCGDRETRDAGVRDETQEGTGYSQGTGYGTPGTAGGTGTLDTAGGGNVTIEESQTTVTTEENRSAGATGSATYGTGSAVASLGMSMLRMPRRYLTVMNLMWGVGCIPLVVVGLTTSTTAISTAPDTSSQSGS